MVLSPWSRREPVKLLIVTQYFLPEMGAPQGHLSDLGEHLVDRGWEVEVLTALPNYPTGRVFEGYPAFRTLEERWGRLRTVRVPLFPSRRGVVTRVATYASFAASALMLGARRCMRPDVIWADSPPLFNGWVAERLSRAWRCPHVLNVNDLWPESGLRLGLIREGWAANAGRWLERRAYGRATAVTCASNQIGERVSRHANGPVDTVTYGVNLDRFDAAEAVASADARLGQEPGPIFVYAGLLGRAQGLAQVVQLADALPARAPGRIVIVGDGPMREWLVRAASQRPRIRVLGPQSRESIPSLLTQCDVALVTLATQLPGAVPSKLYEAMAAELPVLLIAGGEAAQRVERAGCGLVVAPGDASGAVAAFCALATDGDLRRSLGRAGRRECLARYDHRKIARRLDQILRQAVRSHPAGGRSHAAASSPFPGARSAS